MLKHSDLYIPLVVKWFEEFQMVIKKYGNIYACYNKNKKPINRFFYENCDSTQLSGIYLFFENILEKYTANSQKKNYEVSSPVKKNNCRVS